MACHHPPSLYFYPLRPFRTNLIFLCHDSLQIFDDSCHIRAVFSSPSGSTLVPVSSFHRTNTVNFCSLCSLTLFHIYLMARRRSPVQSHPIPETWARFQAVAQRRGKTLESIGLDTNPSFVPSMLGGSGEGWSLSEPLFLYL